MAPSRLCISRRQTLTAALSVSVAAALGPHRLFAYDSTLPPATVPAAALSFQEIPHTYDETHHVAAGYNAEVLIRWGDPVTADAPVFDPNKQTAQSQSTQFGYNNDFVGFVPLPLGSEVKYWPRLCRVVVDEEERPSCCQTAFDSVRPSSNIHWGTTCS